MSEKGEKGQKVKSCFLQNAGALIDPPPITALITAQQILSQVEECPRYLGENHILAPFLLMQRLHIDFVVVQL